MLIFFEFLLGFNDTNLSVVDGMLINCVARVVTLIVDGGSNSSIITIPHYMRKDLFDLHIKQDNILKYLSSNIRFLMVELVHSCSTPSLCTNAHIFSLSGVAHGAL